MQRNIPNLSELWSDPATLDEALDIALCRKEFYHFLRTFWDTIIPDPFIDNWHIKYLCNTLQEIAFEVIARNPRKNDLIINIPPGTTKSTICTRMFPAWCWVAELSRDKYKETYLNRGVKKEESITGADLRFITGSYSAALSLEHADDMREIVRSDKFRKYFPDLVIKRDRDMKSNYKNNHGGSRFSTSVGGTVTGMHGHFLIIDDPLDPNKAISDAERTTANNWMDKTLSTRKVDKEVTVTILIMQRVHQEDPSGHILSRRKRIKHICLPGTTQPFEVNPPELQEYYVDGLLDPIRLTQNNLEDMKVDLGSYGYAGQIGQDPKAREGAMFQREWFEIVDAPPGDGRVVRGWDLAATSEAEAAMKNVNPAYTAGTRIRYHKGIFYIEDLVRGRWASKKVRDIMRNTASQDPPETIQDYPQDPGQAGKDQVQDIAQTLVGFKFKFSPESGDKTLRADPLANQCEAGNVKLVRGSWNEDWLEEACFFPNSEFKDIIDSTVRAFNRLHLPKGRVGTW